MEHSKQNIIYNFSTARVQALAVTRGGGGTRKKRKHISNRKEEKNVSSKEKRFCCLTLFSMPYAINISSVSTAWPVYKSSFDLFRDDDGDDEDRMLRIS